MAWLATVEHCHAQPKLRRSPCHCEADHAAADYDDIGRPRSVVQVGAIHFVCKASDEVLADWACE